MAGSWLDALLGAIRNSGTSVPLSGGLNFAGGLRAVLNRVTGVVDVALVNPPIAPAEQSSWSPVEGDSDTLEAVAVGHDAGFYLVGAQVSFPASPSDGDFTAIVTWSDGVSAGEITGAAVPAAGLVYAAPALVYSDGGSAITVRFTSTVTDETATGVVRATAQRVSG